MKLPRANIGTDKDDSTDELTQDEIFEEKLREAIDLATQKSANGKYYKQ